MSIKKVCGTVVALVVFSGYSAAVFADCLSDPTDRYGLAGQVEDLSVDLRCTDYPSNSDGFNGIWDPSNPIWQHKPKKGGNGCEVHYKLSKLLDDAGNSNVNPGKRNNKTRGAAEALRQKNDTYAVQLLSDFVATIMFAAKLNPEFQLSFLGTNGVPGVDSNGDPAGDSAGANAAEFYTRADNLIACVNILPDSTL